MFKGGHDIYGLKIDNHDANGELVECGNCRKSVAAARFAPHLEKCMGLGRMAARTSKRSAGTATSSSKRAPSSKGNGTTANANLSSASDMEVAEIGNGDPPSQQPSSNNSHSVDASLLLISPAPSSSSSV